MIWINLILGICLLFSFLALGLIFAKEAWGLLYKSAIDLILVIRYINRAFIAIQYERLKLDREIAELEERQWRQYQLLIAPEPTETKEV